MFLRKEIRGECPVFKVGDRIVFDEPRIALDETDAMCIHALGSVLFLLVALSRGVSFMELGLSKGEGDIGYVQCPDLSAPYTCGGTVVFEVKRESKS